MPMMTFITPHALRRTLGPALFTLALLVLSLVITIKSAPNPQVEVSSAALFNEGRWTQLDQLPLRQDLVGDYQVRVLLNVGDSNEMDLHIIPDDQLVRVEVNGEQVDLSKYDPRALRDWKSGVVLSLDTLTPGSPNIIDFSLTNSSNPAGFEVKAPHAFNVLNVLGIVIGLFLLGWALLRHIRLSRPQVGILALGIAVSIAYLLVTDPRTRTFDVYEGGGHRDYIEYLIEERALPPPGEGWEYHQPPLYYSIAAVTKSLLVGAEVESDQWGQLLALWLWVVFLVASLGALRMPLRGEPVILALASIALCLWPSGIIHSIRMGNDVPLYAFYGLSFYYVLKWWGNNTNRDLLWACLWASCALLTKSNAIAVWAVLGCLATLRLFRSYSSSRVALFEMSRPHIALLTTGVFFTLAVAANLGDNVWHYVTGHSSDWLLSNVSNSINPQLRVANAPSNYLLMDLGTFLDYPFMSSWEDQYGRQYFWNYVWRSALTSEFSFTGTPMQIWGLVNGLLILAMLASVALLLVKQFTGPADTRNRQNIYRHLPWILAAIFPFLLLLAYRIKAPLSCNTDFRYIYPVIVPLILCSLLAWKQGRSISARALGTAAPLIGLTSIVWVFMLNVY